MKVRIQNVKKIFIGFALSIFSVGVFAALPQIYVNEISGNEKWLELYNAEDTEVSIGGYKLRKIDENNMYLDWVIPAGTTIPAKGYITWTRGTDANTTFTWGISAKKDVAFKLLTSTNETINQFEVKEALYSEGGSRTVGRRTDGADELIIFTTGTKESSNDNGVPQTPTENPKKIYINEVSGNEKWIEIYNAETEPVDISGYIIWKFDDAGLNDGSFIIPEGTFIAANGFLSWTQDALATDGSTFIWGISAKKEVAFRLLDDNVTELDNFKITESLFSDGANRTVGRKTDGSDELILFLTGGTKGSSNNNGVPQTPTENPKKIFINEVSGNDEWIELYNDEDETVDISGYLLQRINELGSIDTWTIPAGTTIPAKGYSYWIQGTDEGITFTWGISAQKDVAFRLLDNNATELDYFEITSSLYSFEKETLTVGRKVDGAVALVIFDNYGTQGTSNNTAPIFKDPTVSIDTPSFEQAKAYVQGGVLYVPERTISVSVFNISGVEVLSQQLSGNSVSVQQLPKGIYLIRMTSKNNKISTQKLVLAR